MEVVLKMKEFKDKVAVITGAAGGIGRGIADKCVQEGMRVVLADIDAKALSQTEEELKATGATILSVLTDVSKAEDIEALAQKTLDTFGVVHLFSNNAGVYLSKPIWEHSIADWNWILGVNLWSIIHSIRVFIPIMLEQDIECIFVNTASLAGIISGGGIYGMTKHAIVSLSESLYYELTQKGSKVKAFVLCPWYVNTRIWDNERNRSIEEKNDIAEIISDPKTKRRLKIIERDMKRFRRNVEAGISCEKVADSVFQAIRDEKFYILTDDSPWWKELVRNHMESLLKGKNPEVLPTKL